MTESSKYYSLTVKSNRVLRSDQFRDWGHVFKLFIDKTQEMHKIMTDPRYFYEKKLHIGNLAQRFNFFHQSFVFR